MKRIIYLFVFTLIVSSQQGFGQTSKKISRVVSYFNISRPLGLEVDNSHLWLSHDYTVGLSANGVLGKIRTSNKRYERYIPVGKGFLDIESTGYVKKLPHNSNFMWVLLKDGRLIQVDKRYHRAGEILNLKRVRFNATKVYDVQTRRVINMSGFINAASSSYGDFDLYVNKDGSIDMYISGLSQAQTFPFMAKLRIKGNRIIQANILASSMANGTAGYVRLVRLTRGLAVSKRYKKVIMTLPYSTGVGNYADFLVSFPLSFNPSNGVSSYERPTMNRSIDVASQGMTVSKDGMIYVVSNSVGSAKLGSAGKAFIGMFNNRLQFIGGTKMRYTSESLRDVVLSTSERQGYFSSTRNTVYRFNIESKYSATTSSDSVMPTAMLREIGEETMESPVNDGGFSLSANNESFQNEKKTLELGEEMIIGPNPFTNQLNLKFELNTAGKVRMTLMSIDGRVSRQLSDKDYLEGMNLESFQLPSTLPSGMYILKIAYGDGLSKIKKLIKK